MALQAQEYVDLALDVLERGDVPSLAPRGDVFQDPWRGVGGAACQTHFSHALDVRVGVADEGGARGG